MLPFKLCMPLVKVSTEVAASVLFVGQVNHGQVTPSQQWVVLPVLPLLNPNLHRTVWFARDEFVS